MTIINDDTMQPISAPMPVPVQETPSRQIHNKLLNLRDGLDQICVRFNEKLAPVMKDRPTPPESNEVRGNPELPPLFEQYCELIDHIELVVRDINAKLDNVSI